MAGYLSPSASDTSGMSYEAMLYCKTNIAGYFFDGFLRVSHNRSLTITRNPVETGADVVDHAYVNPASITMDIIVSDVHRSLIPGQFEDGTYRHVNAWNVLKNIQNNRIPVSVFTKLDQYDNMLIEELTATDDASTFRSLRATVKLVEIPIARVKTVRITSASQTVVETEMGKIEVENVSNAQAIANWFMQLIGG